MTLTRAEISQHITSNPKAIVAYDNLQREVANNSTAVATGIAATDTINNATVLTLSPNQAFDNERTLALGDGLSFTDGGPGGAFTLLLTYLITLGGAYRCQFDLLADTEVTVPPSGTLLTDDFSALGNYVNDSAAASGGVAVGKLYRNGSAVMVRVM